MVADIAPTALKNLVNLFQFHTRIQSKTLFLLPYLEIVAYEIGFKRS